MEINPINKLNIVFDMNYLFKDNSFLQGIDTTDRINSMSKHSIEMSLWANGEYEYLGEGTHPYTGEAVELYKVSYDFEVTSIYIDENGIIQNDTTNEYMFSEVMVTDKYETLKVMDTNGNILSFDEENYGYSRASRAGFLVDEVELMNDIESDNYPVMYVNTRQYHTDGTYGQLMFDSRLNIEINDGDEVVETDRVDFDSMGGSDVESILGLEAGSLVTKPETPTRQGYTFTNWYTVSTLDTLWNFDSDTVNSNMTLYAG